MKESTLSVMQKAVHLAAFHRIWICAFNQECSVLDGLAVIACALLQELVPWDASDLELPVGHVWRKMRTSGRSCAAAPPSRGPSQPNPVACKPRGKHAHRSSSAHCPRVSPSMYTSVHARYYLAAPDGGPHTNVQQQIATIPKKVPTNEKQNSFRNRKLPLRRGRNQKTLFLRTGKFLEVAQSELLRNRKTKF